MTPNLIALAIPVFLLGIALEAAFGRWRGRRVYRVNDMLGDMGCGVAQQLLAALFTNAAVVAVFSAVYEWRLVTLPTTWLPWVGAVVGVELAYYWWHRLSHEVNLLWAAHVVHHQSEDYNLAVALRQSVATWATGLPFYLPLALLGVPPTCFMVVLGLSTLYQFWIHTELVGPLPRFERWFNSPALHRVHHAINPAYLDRNHAATFMIFDRLFGTYVPETEPCVFGTTRPLRSFNPLWAQAEPVVNLARLAWHAPTWGDRLRVLFASPAWHPPFFDEVLGPVPVRADGARYDARGGPAALRYAFVQWALLIGGVFVFLLWGGSLAPAWTAIVLALFVAGLATLPALAEGRPWARAAEVARMTATAAAGVVSLL